MSTISLYNRDRGSADRATQRGRRRERWASGRGVPRTPEDRKGKGQIITWDLPVTPSAAPPAPSEGDLGLLTSIPVRRGTSVA